LAVAAQALRQTGEPPLPRAIGVAAATLVLGFQALAPAIPTHEAAARFVRMVPGARLVEYGLFEPGMLFYTAATDRFFVAVHQRLADRAKETPEAAHLGLRREDVAAMAGSETPTFVLAKRSHEEELRHAFGLRTVHRSARFALLANAAADLALGAWRPPPTCSSMDGHAPDDDCVMTRSSRGNGPPKRHLFQHDACPRASGVDPRDMAVRGPDGDAARWSHRRVPRRPL
jgi:hypothetical protein